MASGMINGKDNRQGLRNLELLSSEKTTLRNDRNILCLQFKVCLDKIKGILF